MKSKYSSPSVNATVFGEKLATLERWPLVRGKSKYIGSCSGKDYGLLERVGSVASGHEERD